MSKSELATEYIKTIILPMCHKPEDIKVLSQLDEGGLGIVMQITGDDEDIRFLIGGYGGTANSIRGVMRAWGDFHKARVLFHIGDIMKKL